MGQKTQISTSCAILAFLSLFLMISIALASLGLGDWMLTTVLAWPGSFLLERFHAASVYVPLFLGVFAAATSVPSLKNAFLVPTLLSLIPFFTLATLLRIAFSTQPSPVTEWFVENVGLGGSQMFLGLLLALEGVSIAAVSIFAYQRQARTAPEEGDRSSFDPSMDEQTLVVRSSLWSDFGSFWKTLFSQTFASTRKDDEFFESLERSPFSRVRDDEKPNDAFDSPSSEGASDRSDGFGRESVDEPSILLDEALKSKSEAYLRSETRVPEASIAPVRSWNSNAALRDDPFFDVPADAVYRSPALEALTKTLQGERIDAQELLDRAERKGLQKAENFDANDEVFPSKVESAIVDWDDLTEKAYETTSVDAFEDELDDEDEDYARQMEGRLAKQLSYQSIHVPTDGDEELEGDDFADPFAEDRSDRENDALSAHRKQELGQASTFIRPLEGGNFSPRTIHVRDEAPVRARAVEIEDDDPVDSDSETTDRSDKRSAALFEATHWAQQGKFKKYFIPVEGLLTTYKEGNFSEIDEATKRAAHTLKMTLQEFNIAADVTGIRKGPVVTMFEILPAAGVKLSKIVALQDNIALGLAATSVRIVAPIPGKHAVGIEVPNKERTIVGFAEMIQSKEFQESKAEIPMVLGKDISGETQIIDLARTPHLLIAGATGAGKSVCVNTLVCSILYRRSPDEVKLLMVDPKIVELKFFNDIPHLLAPVITDSKKALQAVQWCLYEMERRYALLDAIGAKDIRSYNSKIEKRHIATNKLPYLVLVIDEFADLMATSGKDLEGTIARLAAMSRAVGIHLVLATQRPSVDVITGLIKANFPSRVAFMVASKTDSRIIIDQMGAEKLLGRGDMLFTSSWNPFPSRIQGAYLSEDDVERVVSYVKTLGEPEYISDDIFFDEDEEAEIAGEEASHEADPLFEKAIEIVRTYKKASASFLQRRMGVGYNRAARMIEMMEEMGIVGPQNGSKPREIVHS